MHLPAYDYCKEARDAVNGEPCGPNEICVNSNASYTCECAIGFQRPNPGGECQDVDECTLALGLCHETYQCRNTVGSYDCVCPSGYTTNTTSKQCNDIDECKQSTHLCNIPEERCVNLPGSYRCECNWPAYVASGEFCIDNNECNKNEYNCPLFSTCVNTVGSYNCTCNRGFRASSVVDGRVVQCEDIDECIEDKNDINECVPNNGLGPCNGMPEGTECINTQGSFFCMCPNGYEINSNGTQCIDIDECAIGSDNCTALSETCYNIPGAFNCECSEGYHKDSDGNCVPKAMCDGSIKCGTNALCVMRPSKSEPNKLTPKCVCKDGYFGKDPKRLCEPINECNRTDQCAANAHCRKTTNNDGTTFATCVNGNTSSSVACVCNIGFAGDGFICNDVDECTGGNANICDENATCINTHGSFVCQCKPGYEGNGLPGMCTDVDECTSPVLNRCDSATSNCRNTEGSFECICLPGFEHISMNVWSIVHYVDNITATTYMVIIVVIAPTASIMVPISTHA
uniref:EGF-like domain-containing protein n=1 Tax=Parascaris equorum TaxID=6256 RepID=A0A914S6L0_PAREQ